MAGLTEVRKALPQVVLNTRKAGGDAAAEPEEGPRAFGWLVAVMAALAGVALVGWIFSKRRSVVEAGLVAGTLAVLALLGYYLTRGSSPAAETTSAQTATATIRGGRELLPPATCMTVSKA